MEVLVLGTAQDGGYPHPGCQKKCCQDVWKDDSLKRLVSSVAVINNDNCILIDISPDLKYQLAMIENHIQKKPVINGMFITHAHYGHYIGIMNLGLEVMNASNVPIYVMPKMKNFLETNKPFAQLTDQKNIKLIEITQQKSVSFNDYLEITPIQVPHRNEFSETVGFSISSLDKSVLYIPDIDSWNEWDQDINVLIKEHDSVLLDGTFYDKNELQYRNISDVPHPTIKDSMEKFSCLDSIDRKKVNFTHLNHTNNAIRYGSREYEQVAKKGFLVANDGMIIKL